ncbi:MAG: DUF456 domain-containing protein [Cyclobacteriaceae bacterium]|jgi:hypothetical protein|nr:DUF456 domain-containing protein [Cyclobacteriaceae bacterium]
MDLLWTVLAFSFLVAGIIGSIVPLLPGPPLGYAGMLLLQLRETPVFSVKFLIIWLIVVVVVGLIDYFVPLYGVKKFGGSRFGIWGCFIGLVAGFWMGPLGIIIGPFIGAFIGEFLAHQETNRAFKSAVGSFIGFVFSTLLKLVTCALMGWYMITSL